MTGRDDYQSLAPLRGDELGPPNSGPEAGRLPLDLSGHEDLLVPTTVPLCVEQHEVTTRSALDCTAKVTCRSGSASIGTLLAAGEVLHRLPGQGGGRSPSRFRPAHRTRLYAELLKRLGNLYQERLTPSRHDDLQT